MNEKSKYEPIIRKAECENSAAGKCKWILAMLEILTLNHLPHIEKQQMLTNQAIAKSTRKIVLLLFAVLLIVLSTNPQVIEFIMRFFR